MAAGKPLNPGRQTKMLLVAKFSHRLQTTIVSTKSPSPGFSPPPRGMPRWRQRQRDLPIADKIELLGRFIQQTRQFEAIKKSCKLSATSLNNSSPTAP
jgi:hypothetical protein